jgi:hypothetical protein
MANHWLRRPPASFPLAFHTIVRDGRGYLSIPSGRGPEGFRLQFATFLRVLAAHPAHPLHPKALVRWTMRVDGGLFYAEAHPGTPANRTPLPQRGK